MLYTHTHVLLIFYPSKVCPSFSMYHQYGVNIDTLVWQFLSSLDLTCQSVMRPNIYSPYTNTCITDWLTENVLIRFMAQNILNIRNSHSNDPLHPSVGKYSYYQWSYTHSRTLSFDKIKRRMLSYNTHSSHTKPKALNLITKLFLLERHQHWGLLQHSTQQ